MLTLMPARALPPEALTFLMVTARLLPLPLQLPQERYSFPKSWTVKPSMVTELAPLFWMTWSYRQQPKRISCNAILTSLNYLIIGTTSTTAGDLRSASALEGESVFADGGPPNVLERARAKTVNALDLVLADDDILEGSTVLQKEDGILVAALLLASAGDTTVVGLVATVKGTADFLRGLVGDRSLRGWDVE